jgi:6-phosphogluconolactonase (cycloisomerase 2 family)
MKRIAVVLGVVVLLVSSAAAAAPRAPRGALTLLRGPGACLGPGAGCGNLRGPTGLLRLAVSPDGRTVYATGQAGGLAVLARDPVTGRLHQVGCLRRDGRQGCRRAARLIDPGAIAVSPDGRSVYVTTQTGILAFARNRRTGALRAAGCLDSGAAPGCGGLRAPTNPTELLAAGNGTVYATGPTTDGQGNLTGALAVLTRNPHTAALHQAACLDDDGSHSCGVSLCIDQITVMALARNGTRLYTGASDSLSPEDTAPGDVATFARTPGTGALNWLGCNTRRAAVSDVRPVPHSSRVLVATLYGNRGLGTAGGSLDLYRPGPGGVLGRVRTLACVRHAPCPVPYYIGPARLAITPAGDTAFVSMIFGGITVLHVGPHAVSQLAGRSGCVISASHYMPPHGCALEGPEIGADMAVSPDGRDLYVGTLGSSSSQYYRGGVETFAIGH